jgi:hypothetical protein
MPNFTGEEIFLHGRRCVLSKLGENHYLAKDKDSGEIVERLHEEMAGIYVFIENHEEDLKGLKLVIKSVESK